MTNEKCVDNFTNKRITGTVLCLVHIITGMVLCLVHIILLQWYSMYSDLIFAAWIPIG